jgi:hypothetical protein
MISSPSMVSINQPNWSRRISNNWDDEPTRITNTVVILMANSRPIERRLPKKFTAFAVCPWLEIKRRRPTGRSASLGGHLGWCDGRRREEGDRAMGGWIRREMFLSDTSASWRLNYWAVGSIRNVLCTWQRHKYTVRAPAHVAPSPDKLISTWTGRSNQQLATSVFKLNTI